MDLRDLVDRTLQIAAAQLRGSGVKSHNEIAEDMPQPLGHADQVQQVLLNLVTNAVHAMESGPKDRAVHITGRVTTLRHRRCAVVDVRDTGPGIPQESVDRVFDPFFTTKPEGKGTGLGLSTSYRIAVDHGGLIEADNHPEGGAIFRIFLPMGAAGEAS